MVNVSRFFRKNFSQHGEDGIIEKIFEVLDIPAKWVCEYGAGNGIDLSNTYNLISNSSSGVLIEGDKELFKELVKNMKYHKDVFCDGSFISLDKGNKIDDILSNYPIPKDFDFLSMDIDGNDYWIWDSIKEYRPKVIVAEYNTNLQGRVAMKYDPNHIWDWSQCYGASALAFEKLGKEKGYDLIGIELSGNIFFVQAELNKGLFEILDLNKVPYLSTRHKPMNEEQKKKIVQV